MKAQSAIEYLVSYGWMLVAVAVIGGGLYQVSGGGCNVEVSGLQGSQLVAEDVGINTDDQLSLAFRSSSNREIIIKEVEFDNGSVNQIRDLVIEPGETKEYKVANTERTEGCSTIDMVVTYDIGPVNSQKFYGELTAPAQVIDVIINYLKVSGGEIKTLKVESTVGYSSSEMCVGDQCDLTETGDTEQVNRSGDQMTGYLEVRNLEFECFGDQCDVETGSYPGYVNTENNTMDGTLNVTEVTYDERLCLGSCQ